MTQVRVFNPADTPVYIDNGKVIPGGDWATVKRTQIVNGLIGNGSLIDKTPPSAPQKTAEPTPEPTVADDAAPSPEVSSEEETTTEVIDTDNQPKPASMKRRRKSPSPTKE